MEDRKIKGDSAQRVVCMGDRIWLGRERGSYRIWDMTQDRRTGNFFRAGRKMQVQK